MREKLSVRKKRLLLTFLEVWKRKLGHIDVLGFFPEKRVHRRCRAQKPLSRSSTLVSGSSADGTASCEGDGSGHGSGWLQHHLIAQVFQAANEPPLDGLPISLVEVAAAEFLVFLLAKQDVIGHHEQGMCQCDQRLLPATSCGQTVILSG